MPKGPLYLLLLVAVLDLGAMLQDAFGAVATAAAHALIAAVALVWFVVELRRAA